MPCTQGLSERIVERLNCFGQGLLFVFCFGFKMEFSLGKYMKAKILAPALPVFHHY